MSDVKINFPPLSDAQIKELEFLKNQKDSDIDTSDIPELTDEQLSQFHKHYENPQVELIAKSVIYDENQEWLLSLGSDYKKNLNYVIKWAKEHNCTLVED